MSNDAFLGNKKYPRKSRCTLHINVNFLILHHLCLIQSKFNAYFNFSILCSLTISITLMYYFIFQTINEEAGSVV